MTQSNNSTSKTSIEAKVGAGVLKFETGGLAKFANGAALVTLGESVVLATATAASNPKAGFPDFVPLTVDYRERYYAAGQIPGGFFKREGRSRQKEVLSSRLVDRSLRPLFNEFYNTETQVPIIVLSADTQNDTDVLAINAASCALLLSDIPWEGPVGAVRIGRVNEKFIVNPSKDERVVSDLEMVVSGRKEGIMMVEGGASELPEDLLLEALGAAKTEIDKLCGAQLELQKKVGAPKKTVTPFVFPEGMKAETAALAQEPVKKVLRQFLAKSERDAAIRAVVDKAQKALAEKFPDSAPLIRKLIDDILYDESRRMVLDERVRADGRKLDEVRPIQILLSVLPRTHGSAIFTRGETQALVSTTLGTTRDKQIMDELDGEYKERFLLHYNFPGFSTGEVKPDRGPGRREIGHGALARRALWPLLPPEEDFAYTLRLVSDILASNGSSSMASVCGGSLALFDAGVPLRASCSGIAMGLISGGDRHAILSDIMGLEDHLGDMDFKIAGSRKGITAIQMDIKIDGLSLSIMKEALEQARTGRLHILDLMDSAIRQPRQELSKYAPRMHRIQIPVDKIGALIGPGGKNIRKLCEEYEVEIDVDDDGNVFVCGTDGPKAEAALQIIKYSMADAEVGKIYKGKVVSVLNFGAFVEILPGKEGLLHISQIDNKRVERVEDVLHEGDEVEVKVLEIDNMGKIRLSRKAVLFPGSELTGGDRPNRGSSRPENARRGSFRKP
ncbi:MAG: polyribonucleotide nucleotidyltransferase [Elusimicrobia bacterium]|nr:polyribonucleotide nucleotidyltransferase [Elusimicrobiota bacterium]